MDVNPLLLDLNWSTVAIPILLSIGVLGFVVALWTPRARQVVIAPGGPSLGKHSVDVPVLTARSLSKAYRTPSGESVVVLDDVNLDIPSRGLTALIGPSGTGKSTLMNLFGGLDTPDSGQVLFRGEPLPAHECDALRSYRAQHVSLIFQELTLISHLTAEETCALPLVRQGVPRRLALQQAREALRVLGLPLRLARRRPAQLSGGERQRVAIARAMVGDSHIVLADEPTGSLDRENAVEVMKNLRRLADERGIPVVLVTHNLDLAHRYADLVLELGDGGSVRRKDVTPRRADHERAASKPRKRRKSRKRGEQRRESLPCSRNGEQS